MAISSDPLFSLRASLERISAESRRTVSLYGLLIWRAPLSFPDTEIDWSTYVQQVEAFLSGTRDYGQIRGDTGPCVYPAGHLYINSLFYFLSSRGRDIFAVQWLFIGVYLINLLLVYRICLKTNLVSSRV